MEPALAPDFDALTVGDRFATRGRTVTEADVASFAALTGDMHPQHTDAVWAAKSPFGARIAHGMLVVSYAVGLLALDPERVIALRRVRQAVFKRPVMVGDTIRAEAKVDSLEAVRDELGGRWGQIDGLLHAIAFAPDDAIGGAFLDTPPESALTAFQTSAYSLKALTAALAPLFAPRASVVGLDFDASVAWPAYDWMGVSKAALEAVARYLARDLGPRGARVNLVSAGPLRTAAASGIDGFGALASGWGRRAPLGWDPEDATPVARAVCFLLSDWSEGVTGEILHVDGGYHAIGAAEPPVAAC